MKRSTLRKSKPAARAPATLETTVEGVVYRPVRVEFTDTRGRRRRVRLWTPGATWTRDIVTRYLDRREDVDAAKPVVVRDE